MLFYAVNFFLKFCNIKQNLGINSTFRWNVGIVTMWRASVWYHLSAHGPFRSACFARWLDRVQLNSLSSEISSNGESTSQFHFHLRYLAMQLEFNQFDLPALLTLCEKYCVCRDFFDKLSSAIFSNPIWPASPSLSLCVKCQKARLRTVLWFFAGGLTNRQFSPNSWGEEGCVKIFQSNFLEPSRFLMADGKSDPWWPEAWNETGMGGGEGVTLSPSLSGSLESN